MLEEQKLCWRKWWCYSLIARWNIALGKDGVRTGRKGLGAVSKETVLVASSCVQAASYKFTN